MPELPTLNEFVRGESIWFIEPLLQKGQSVLLASDDKPAAACLALQLALNVANGSKFLGRYQAAKGKVVFVELDAERLKADAQLYEGDPGREAIRVLNPRPSQPVLKDVSEHRPYLTVIGPGAEEGVWNQLAEINSVVAVSGMSWNDREARITNRWILERDKATETPVYTLKIPAQNIVLRLGKTKDGFIGLTVPENLPAPTYWKPPRIKMLNGQIVRDNYGKPVFETPEVN